MEKVVQGIAVDDGHLLAFDRHRREGEGGAVRAAQAVGAEVGQMLALGRIGRVVPVADVNHPQAVVGLRQRPGQEAGDRPLRGIVAHQPARLVVADVQQVGQGRERRQRLDEIVLQTLGNEHALAGAHPAAPLRSRSAIPCPAMRRASRPCLTKLRTHSRNTNSRC